MSPPSTTRPREDPQRVAALLIVLRQVIAEVNGAGGKLKGSDRLLSKLDEWLERGGGVRKLEEAAVRLYKLGDPWRRTLPRGPETIEDHSCAAADAGANKADDRPDPTASNCCCLSPLVTHDDS